MTTDETNRRPEPSAPSPPGVEVVATSELMRRYEGLVKTGAAYAAGELRGAPTSTFEIYVGHFRDIGKEIAASLDQATRRAEEAEQKLREQDLQKEQLVDQWVDRHDEAHARADVAEARVTALEQRYENWQPMSVTPASQHHRQNTLLHFYMPGDDTDENPATWITRTWDERPVDAVAWCSISTPYGPPQAFFEALSSTASSITEKETPDA